MELLKNWREWVDFIFPLLIFGGIYLYRHYRQYKKARGLREVAPFINSEVVHRPFTSPRLRGTYMGIPFHMVFLPATRGAPERMQIKLEFACHFGLEVIPRGRGSGLEELFVKAATVATGDDAFDNAVLIRVEKDKDKAMLYLDNPINRQGILSAFNNGFNTVRFSEKNLILNKPGDFLGPDGLTPEMALKDLEIATHLLQQI